MELSRALSFRVGMTEEASLVCGGLGAIDKVRFKITFPV